MIFISFTLNGQAREISVDQERSLLKVLRENFGLIGTKEGCSAGHCGTCAVLVNGKVVMSCHYPAIKANGAEIVTIEGIGTPDNPHPIQQAFVQAGAVQCGFCTPGMIIRAKALLDNNANPSREQIIQAFTPHLCRCTGYVKIIDAVELAAQWIRGEAPVMVKTIKSVVQSQFTHKIVGQRIPRADALAKATGCEHFAADLHRPDMLYLKILHSLHAHAKILSIDTSKAQSMAGVRGVFTAADITGTNRLKISRADQPVLCDGKVRYVGDSVAVVVADSESVAEQALAKIEVQYEQLPAVYDPWLALEDGAPQIHSDHPNLLAQQTLIQGNVDDGFAQADIVLDQVFTTPLIEHAYLEPDAGIAYLDQDGQLVIHAGSQNIHHDRKALAEALGIEPKMVRIIQTPTGGAFGGKLDISVQGVLGLAALKLGKPVKLVYTREETFLCTTKRHGYHVRCRVGATKNGKMLALEMEIMAAGGAYASFSKSVLSRAIIHATGPYRIPHVRVNGTVVYTNGPVAGAMRGFGVPQVSFALESQLDILAEKLGLNPVELRLMNCFRQGDRTATSQVLAHEIGMAKCLEAIEPYYKEALAAAQDFNAQNTRLKRGIGIAGMWFGPGKSKPDESEAHSELQADGTLTVWIGAADIGQGSDTVFAQIAAEELGLAIDAVTVISKDTLETPDGGYSSGSRQTYMSGQAVRSSVAKLRSALLDTASRLLVEEAAQLECMNGTVFSRIDLNRSISLSGLAQAGFSGRYVGRKEAEISTPDPETGAGVPYETYAFGVQMAEVEVNLDSGEVKVIRVVAAHDSGTPINPLYMEGQIEGGILMGLGNALMEEYIPNKTVNFARYRIPRMKDMPVIHPIIIEVPRPGGPFGATGIAEAALVPTVPAIVNAICSASGVRIYNLPAKIIDFLPK